MLRGDALLVGVGADLRWLTGYAPRESERLTMLVLAASGRPLLVVPRLELVPAEGSPAASAGLVDVLPWEEDDDPVERVVDALPAGSRDALFVSDRLWAAFLLRLQAVLPGASYSLASEVLRELRMVKDSEEVALLREAAAAADRAMTAIAGGRLVGRSEADVAREVRERLVDEGHDEAEFAIVASGPNSASPHHEPSERTISAGEPLVLDIGGTVSGYGSDITRTIWVTGGGSGPDAEYGRLYEVLQRAQATATRAVRAGVPCESIDRAARDVIEDAGYGHAFVHRTGHGIGLEGHEEPYLVAGNGEPLREGHAFSVEPGVYLEDRYGARIEDIVVCRADGPDVLNAAPRDLLVVTGA